MCDYSDLYFKLFLCVVQCSQGNFGYCFVLNQQGLQRRATPHPSELKVMKNVIEARRNEAYTAKPDEELDSPDTEVCICMCVHLDPSNTKKRTILGC